MSLRVKQDRSDSRVLVIENASGLVFKDHIIELVGGISLRIEPRETSAITGIVVDKGIIPLIVRLLNGYEPDQARPSPVPALNPDSVPDASAVCLDDVRQVHAKKLRDALDGLLSRTMRNTCCHDDTTRLMRGTALYDECNQCDAVWKVENGGKPKWVDPPEWTAAKKALADTEYLAK
jgi:hypothetical protein